MKDKIRRMKHWPEEAEQKGNWGGLPDLRSIS